MSRKDFQQYLDELGPPEHDHPENGGRVPMGSVNCYGGWLRRTDPIAFEVGYGEWKREVKQCG
jgi:hypothetical protein